jgi:hypothetical protein
MSDCTLAFSQGIQLIQTNYFKAECAKWKSARDSSNNPHLTRKFNKWCGENLTNASSLVKSVIHPISKLRLESHVAVIRFKELPVGFRVLCGEVVSVESLPSGRIESIREIILCNQTKDPDNIWCIAMFHIEAIDATNKFSYQEYGFGPYSNIAAIQKKAATENDRQADLIKMLNKEI